ncbi:glycosyltransferase [Butyrivibrio sp. INlla14]|uniref:glycosyltransferase n=1 Tax=Butyrivibrio sp. INlla14 TaxID=1520808 RepID=UPI0008760D37|nr:glycosyltransferase [Butyrivibrio sp. INlla14]SCY42686.1 Glycosyltransferase involved in cell wall bisynthesis [Butyrivibrio sp. INlla14]
MKTILHVTEVLSGGVLPVVSGICNGLCDKYNFVVAYGIRPDMPDNLSDHFDSRVKLIPIPDLKLKLSLRGDLSAIRAIKKIVKEESPDIIHIHSTKAGIDARIGLLGCEAVKYYTPHGFCFLRKDQLGLKRFVLRTMEIVLARLCDGIIACGKYEYEEAKRITSKALLVENGLDTDYMDDILDEEDEYEHQYTIYTAGRIGPQKNPKVFNAIAEKMIDYKFVWIGDGEDRALLKSKNIEVTGVLDRREVIKKAVNFDCYISTSLWEGLPIALMEAMYMEKECVVTDIEGNNELIIDGKSGRLFRSLDEAFKALTDEKKSFGVNAKQRIVDNYTLVKMCEKYEKVYG